MVKNFGKSWMFDTVVEIVGCILAGIAVNNFALAAEFPMTGFSGLALILYRLFGLPIGWMSLVMNIPVAILCYRRLGRQFFLRSMRCMVISSLVMDYLVPLFPSYTGDRLIAAVCAGVLGGVGYAIIYLRNSSTGGTDFIVLALKSRYPHLSLGKFILATDCSVVLLGGIIFRDFDGVIYGAIIGFCFAVISDKIMYGINSGKLALIVTNRAKDVVECIDKISGRGATILDARGGYHNDPREVVMCACSDKELISITREVKLCDPASFTVVLESNEVHGEGFHMVEVAQPVEHQEEDR